jgi:hypothetical protein
LTANKEKQGHFRKKDQNVKKKIKTHKYSRAGESEGSEEFLGGKKDWDVRRKR